MRLLSRIIFGDYFKYERTFDGDINDSRKKLFQLFSIKDIKVTLDDTKITLTWSERSNKFQFRGMLSAYNGKTKLTGEFVLGAFNVIKSLIWFSFWAVGYILWKLRIINLHKAGDEIGFLICIVVGLVLSIFFVNATNKKVKEITEVIDALRNE